MEGAYDILVIGGGPAGAATALWLARAGFAVALLDRAQFPRDKACGEFLTPEACRLLADLGAWEAVRAAGARPVAATVLVASDGREMRYVHPSNALPGHMLRRIRLDAILLETARQAGARVVEGFAVRDLLVNDCGEVSGVSGVDSEGRPTIWRARLVVGADGSHSRIARQLGLVKVLPRLQRVAVVTHWRGVSGLNDTLEMRARREVVCGLGFPDAFSANLTLVLPTGMASQIAGRAGDFVEETITRAFPDLAERLRGARREPVLRTIGCFGHVCKPCVAAGALLVGDAATFIDPFTGEGVYFALRGAQLAAEVAAAALHAGDVSSASLRAYHRARGELARRYLLCDLVQAVVRAPALFNRVVSRLQRRPEAVERLLSVLGDTRPPTEALHPAFLWQLLAPEWSVS